MKRIIVIVSFLITILCANAQNNLVIKITDGETKENLLGATAQIQGTNIGASANNDGIIELKNITSGKHIVICRFIGYKEQKIGVELPLTAQDTLFVMMTKEENELEDIIIVSTRSNRSIKNIPTRVEFISAEELDEKASMKSSDIRMLLSESTGIMTQQTSATSGNASIRIQGLDGRYTQILKDGFPAFNGAASGLGLLQTPPLDLKQVEIVKGSSSTLYGAGAIAGLVNLISKTPEDERELMFHLDATHTKGADINVFYSERYGKIGATFFTAFNHNGAYAPSNTDFTAIPFYNRFVLNPKLFVYFSKNTNLNIDINSMIEDRKGGDIHYLKDNGNTEHTYFEYNKTKRFSSQGEFNHAIDDRQNINVKTSFSYFNRKITLKDYVFTGRQNSLFSEINYSYNKENISWIAGVNLWNDDFNEQKHSDFALRNFTQATIGAFVQSTYAFNTAIALEIGLRYDCVFSYGTALLPRISVLYKINDKISSRLGGGFGYKIPTIFTEETEMLHYRNVLPIDDNENKLEKSYGANWDVNFVTSLFNNTVSLTINQLLFITCINNPLLLKSRADGLLFMDNIDGYTLAKGTETNVKIGYEDIHLYLGYTYTDAYTKENSQKSDAVLAPKHRMNIILMYEREDEFRLGLESYYYSSQLLSDGTHGRQYVIFGFLAEKMWDKFSVYANFENFTDRRQTRFASLYTGSHNNPIFSDIYAPLEGFVFTLGIKLKL
ncbi:MAG: TonB-dependent receptor [Bacteroidales bacterium]|nr:TonB-dependent receptor [Bacteroidales bacterium]